MYKAISLKDLKNLPDPIEKDLEVELLNTYKDRVNRKLKSNFSQVRKLKLLNKTTKAVFEDFGLSIKYVGAYGPSREDPERSNPYPYGIGDGCSGIPIYDGVIGITIRLYGKSMYVPDVEAAEKEDPKSHFSCDSTMKGAEIVIALPTKFEGKRATRIVYDIDIARKNPFSDEGVLTLEQILIPVLKDIFKSKLDYKPILGLHMPKVLELVG